MILTADHILKELEADHITIEPFERANLGTNSYDVTLAPELLVYDCETLDPRARNPTTPLVIPEEGLVLEPGELYLGSINEVVGSDRYVPCLEGRSSLARLGISIHQTAGFGDLGFIARWTIEVMVIRPVRVYPGMRIGQFAFHEIKGTIGKLYSGKYGQQQGVEASKSFEDREVPRGEA